MSIGKIDAPLEQLSDERLGVGPHIAALTDFIRQCDTPMTIAIQGDWGTGKTSMMQVVEKQLLEEKDKGKYGTVKFNTWQFSQFDLQDDVPVVLLMELLRAFGCEESKAKKFFLGGIKKAGGIFGALIGGAEGREAMKQLLEADPTNMISQIKELKKDLEKAVKDKREKDKVERIVVFIDDLDRMNPGKAVELLEIIKNFLDIEGCVYVLAVDYGVVSRGVRVKYGEDMDELKGRSFFDKIIQLPFNLPVAQYEIENYLKELFGLNPGEARIYKKLAETSVGTNPRALKRMANTLKLIELVAIKKNQFDKEHEVEFRRALFASLCLQMAFEPVYAQILGSGQYMDFLKDLDENAQAVMDKFKEAIQKFPGGKPEVVEKRLKSFFKALDESIPVIDDEKNYDSFDAAMRLSGVTATGAQSAEEKEKLMNTFDPKLMGQLKNLLGELETQYQSFWEMIDLNPSIDEEEVNTIYIPLTWGGVLNYIIALEKEGIDRYFYSDCDDSALKKEYRNLLDDKIAPSFQNITKGKGNSKTLFKLPVVNWKTDASLKSMEATHDRYEQVRELLNRECAVVIPTLEKALKSAAPALNQIQNFLAKIKENLELLFPNTWEIEIKNKGNILYDGWEVLTIRKPSWVEGTFIYLASFGGEGQNITFSFYYADLSPSKKDLKTVLDAFSKKQDELGIGEASQDDTVAVINSLPENLQNWLSGSVFEGDLKYILNVKEENEIIDIVKKCSEIFISLGETLDSIAEE